MIDKKIEDLLSRSKSCFRKDFAEALSLCEQASAMAEELQWEESALEALAAKAHICSYSGKDEHFAAYINSLFDRSRQLKNYVYLEQAWTMKGAFLWNRSLYQDALSCFQESKKLLAKVKSPDNHAMNRRNLGMTYGKLGDSVKAKQYFRQALKWAKKADNKAIIASVNYRLGLELEMNGKFKEALKIFYNALHVFEEVEDYYGAGITLNSIGLIYRDVTVLSDKDRFNNAIDYFMKSKEYAEKCGENRLIADIYNNIGLVHIKNKDYDKTLENYYLSLKYRRLLPFKENEAITLQNIGNVHCEMGDNEKAYEYYQESLKIRRDLGNKYYLANCLLNLLFFLVETDRMDEASEIYTELQQLVPELDNKRRLLEIYDSFTAYLTKVGDFEKALLFNKKCRLIEDELYRQDLDVQLKNIEDKHKLKMHKLQNDKRIAIEKEKAARAMACTTCHEMSQPLTVLQGYFELLMETNQKVLQGKETQSYIESIRNAIKSINKLLLALSSEEEIEFGYYLEDTDMVVLKKDKE